MLVYVIRHAESLANTHAEEGLNTGLSPLGLRQAEALARRFGGLPIAAIYSSPFLRSIQTALPVARRLAGRGPWEQAPCGRPLSRAPDGSSLGPVPLGPVPIRIRPELCEFQGLLAGTQASLGLDDIAESVRRHPETIACPDHTGPFVWPPLDEPLAAMIARVRAFADSLKARWSGKDDTVIVVGHGSPSARLIEAWLTDEPGPSFRFTIDNAAVSALRYVDGVSSLVCLNEISHLRGLPVSERANYRADGSIKPVSETGVW